MATYAEIILPLALEGTLTYLVPDRMERDIEVGRRVAVPLGKSRTLVGLVGRTHDEKPPFDVRPIGAVLDARPVVTATQMRLWKWISEYYMCPIGMVMDAALPAELKSLEPQRPRTTACVELSREYREDGGPDRAMRELGNAPRQRAAFGAYLSLSRWDGSGGGMDFTPDEVTKEELMNASHSTAATIKALVDRGILATYQRAASRLNLGGEPRLDGERRLTTAQQDAHDAILQGFSTRNVVLLHGVTSSGKTEIYMRLIRETLESGKQVLYLLPEIALTVQMRQRLQGVLGNLLGIYHSKCPDWERREIWERQLSGDPYGVILGPRSAALIPFRDLGLVIVDEEHEHSYKQQDPAPRYHARDAAIMLARMHGAKTLLGSATPSSESYQNAMKGKYGYVWLGKRHGDMMLPEIQVVDTRDLARRKMMDGPFSPVLIEATREALGNGEQAILFQNRRGYVPVIECRDCGWVPRCEACDVSLTLHKRMGKLTCHYRGAAYGIPDTCPECGGHDLRGHGFGTEKIEDKVMEIFPGARVSRMDLDTTHSRRSYERMINDFSAHRTDIMIGTQMISKGLDFDSVRVVGILDADSMLNLPDFRAFERAFMMMAQVSGRAGRKGKRGLVLLQTRSPDLPVIRQVVDNDCTGFYGDLLEERRLFGYPPFCRLVYMYFRHREDGTVEAAATMAGRILRKWFGSRVLGPDKPAVAKVKALHIRKIVIKLEGGLDLAKARQYLRMAADITRKHPPFRGVEVLFDVDPL